MDQPSPQKVVPPLERSWLDHRIIFELIPQGNQHVKHKLKEISSEKIFFLLTLFSAYANLQLSCSFSFEVCLLLVMLLFIHRQHNSTKHNAMQESFFTFRVLSILRSPGAFLFFQQQNSFNMLNLLFLFLLSRSPP